MNKLFYLVVIVVLLWLAYNVHRNTDAQVHYYHTIAVPDTVQVHDTTILYKPIK